MPPKPPNLKLDLDGSGSGKGGSSASRSGTAATAYTRHGAPVSPKPTWIIEGHKQDHIAIDHDGEISAAGMPPESPVREAQCQLVDREKLVI
jgi:hypothetical protein